VEAFRGHGVPEPALARGGHLDPGGTWTAVVPLCAGTPAPVPARLSRLQCQPVSRIRPPADFNPRSDPPLDFPDADYGSLTPGDYEALGFMAGLEVHQQLATRSKLFCRCPAGRFTTHHDSEVLRHMRPTLSELGEYDGTALMEFKTRKEIVYLLDRATVCTYEMDDTPPFEIDGEAVEIAIEMAQLLDLSLVAELHVMRKQYLDGSIPTGFQRTAMVGLTGRIPFRVPELGVDRELAIRQLSLEEDSCREVSDLGHRIMFRTDRLGMPLTEAVTEPEFRTPLEVREGGRLLAAVAQVTGKVRRGLGAARQDVNVSIAGGRRIEIKGVPTHRSIPRLVHNEAIRQLNLLRLRAELARRGVTAAALAIPDGGHPWDVSPLAIEAGSLFGSTAPPAIARGRDLGLTICAVRLTGFGGLLAHPTQPGLTFAHEIAERVRVIACPAPGAFLAHSDQPDSAIAAAQWRELRTGLRAEASDAIVVLWAEQEDAATGGREVLIRAQEATIGIPAETRQAYPGGATGFERILPGPDRMYPDTDTPPLPIADHVVDRVRASLGETPWERMARYEGLGLDPENARALALAPWAAFFDEATPPRGDLARRLAASLAKRWPRHARAHREAVRPHGATLGRALRKIESGSVRVEALDRVVDAALQRPGASVDELLAPFGLGGADGVPLDDVVRDVTAGAAIMAGRSRDTLLRWAMGEAMPQLLGRADPADVRRRLVAGLEGLGTAVTS